MREGQKGEYASSSHKQCFDGIHKTPFAHQPKDSGEEDDDFFPRTLTEFVMERLMTISLYEKNVICFIAVVHLKRTATGSKMMIVPLR
jgi:hypothetical protein